MSSEPGTSKEIKQECEDDEYNQLQPQTNTNEVFSVQLDFRSGRKFPDIVYLKEPEKRKRKYVSEKATTPPITLKEPKLEDIDHDTVEESINSVIHPKLEVEDDEYETETPAKVDSNVAEGVKTEPPEDIPVLAIEVDEDEMVHIPDYKEKEKCKISEFIYMVSDSLKLMDARLERMILAANGLTARKRLQVHGFKNFNKTDAIAKMKNEVLWMEKKIRTYINRVFDMTREAKRREEEKKKPQTIENIILRFNRPIFRINEFRRCIPKTLGNTSVERILSAVENLREGGVLVKVDEKIGKNSLVLKETRLSKLISYDRMKKLQFENCLHHLKIDLTTFREMMESLSAEEFNAIMDENGPMFLNVFKLAILKNPGEFFTKKDFPDNMDDKIRLAIDQLTREGLVTSTFTDQFKKVTNDHHLEFRLTQYGISIKQYLAITSS